MARLFLSYRRSDTGAYADRLAARLSQFQFEAVFQDREDIGLADNYADQIRSALSRCDALLVLIGGNWANARDGAGRRRLDDPADWVRREVTIGLSLGVPAIPVLFDAARVPAAADLPGDLAPLATAQGYDVNGNYFDRDADDLARRLERSLVAAARSADGQTSKPDPFLSQLLLICACLFVVTLASAIVPSFAPALPPSFWFFPGAMTLAAFTWWLYFRGESARLRTRAA